MTLNWKRIALLSLLLLAPSSHAAQVDTAKDPAATAQDDALDTAVEQPHEPRPTRRLIYKNTTNAAGEPVAFIGHGFVPRFDTPTAQSAIRDTDNFLVSHGYLQSQPK